MITKNYVQTEIKFTSGERYSLRVTDAEGNCKIYNDLTKDITALQRFANLINKGNVSPIHIDELIEDFLP